MSPERQWRLRVALSLVGLCAAFVMPTVTVAAEEGSARTPNVVVVLIDDLGWTDLGCYGSHFYETPHIDRLARQGMRFTTAYSACTVCSPTRAALLTGKYPARLHVTDWIAGHRRPYAMLQVPDWTMHLPLEEETLAERLKAAGYATASIGKWHLGGQNFGPTAQGFDLNVAGANYGTPPSYFDPFKNPTITDRQPGEYLTDRLTDEALAFIERNQARPFFLYLPHYGVHTPIQAPKELVEKYRKKAGSTSGPDNNAVYAAMIEAVDNSVGRIIDKLEDLKLATDTLVIFTSDNGGLLPVTSNRPLRAGKGSAYEGGVRVPLIVRWPEVVEPGSTSDLPVITQDLFYTILDAASDEAARDQKRTRDGLSLTSAFKGGNQLDREALYWHYPHYHPGGATPYGAVRAGDYRLIEFYEDGRLELFNLKNDVSELTNLAAAMPEKTKELHGLLVAWRKDLNAQMPSANPDHDPARANEPGTKRAPQPRPNFVVVLCDDLGYGDLGCYGHPDIKTPNLDRLAAQGLRFTDCYASAPVCSPSRAGLLTGRFPQRLGILDWIPAGSPMHLKKDEVTLASLLRDAGYATCHVGKWHCNGKFNSPQQPQPGDHGFDHWMATQNNANPNHRNPVNFVRNGQRVGKLEGYSSTVIVNEALDWLRKQRSHTPGKPLLLFVWFHSPHEIVATAEEFVNLYADAMPKERAIYYGNVTQLDFEVGRLISAVDELKASDNTLVFFTSDNGPETLKRYPTGRHSYGSPGELRGMKLHLHEGGIRVPGIVRFPARVEAGAVSSEPICNIDVLPTFCELAGVPLSKVRMIDGASFTPVLEGKPIARKTPLFWQYDYALGNNKLALRDGDWKLLADGKLSQFELYNLKHDHHESMNLVEKETARATEMRERLTQLHKEVEAERPRWPDWQPPAAKSAQKKKR